MRRIFATLITCLFYLISFSQTHTVSNSVRESGYGLIRTNMALAYDHGWGHIEDNFAARISYEFLKNRHFSITANARYTSNEVKFNTGDLSHDLIPELINLNGTHILTQFGFTSTFKTRLFSKPFMCMAMLTTEWYEKGFGRVSGIAMGLFMLRNSRETQFGIGPLVMICTNSKIPAFPVFMYRHHLNNRWLVSLYGGMFGVEYTPTQKDMLSFGADIDVKAFYFRPGIHTLPRKCRFSSTSCRPSVKYKRCLAPNLYFEAQTGISLKMSCRLTGATGTTEYADCNQKISPFIQAGVSYSL